MDHHDTATTDVVRLAKKKIRLSQVVDKLSGLGNGNMIADKENNNIPGEHTRDFNTQIDEQVQLYGVTPQLTPTVSHNHTQAVIQQAVPSLPQQFYPLIPGMLTPSPDSRTKIPQINLPLIGTTVPDLLSVLPENRSAMLQNLLMYNKDMASHFYGFGPQTLSLWQLAMNSQRNFSEGQTFHTINRVSPSDTIKQEPDNDDDDDDGKMVIDETYEAEDSSNVRTSPIATNEIELSNKKASRSPQQQTISGDSYSLKPNIYHPHQTSSGPSHHIPIAHFPSNKLINSMPIPAHLFNGQNSDLKPIQQCNDFADISRASNNPINYKMEPRNVKIELKSEYNGSTDSESEISSRGNSSSPQSSSGNGDVNDDLPLDLSVKNVKKERKFKGKSVKKLPREPKRSPSQEELYPEVRGDVASPTTRETVAARYNMEVSPVVEQMPDGADTAWACPVCGQLFSQKDRLAKHVACRHRGRSPSRTHVCWSCNRGFSRSDMLTRHLRLHTGQKPYRCLVCGQIFSRSDHLATHRRTHTGEKPYKCPQCSYSACRRDMITRHMRTHKDPGSSTQNTSSSSPSHS